MENIYDIAKWFLNKSSMTPKKLQKMVYYAYAWFITLMNEDANNIENRLFNVSPQAWVHGPVFPNLYQKYKDYGYSDIPAEEAEFNFNEDVEDVLNQVWEVYGKYNANELESLTHQELPWRNARTGCSPFSVCTNDISDKDIFECYSARLV